MTIDKALTEIENTEIKTYNPDTKKGLDIATPWQQYILQDYMRRSRCPENLIHLSPWLKFTPELKTVFYINTNEFLQMIEEKHEDLSAVIKETKILQGLKDPVVMPYQENVYKKEEKFSEFNLINQEIERFFEYKKLKNFCDRNHDLPFSFSGLLINNGKHLSNLIQEVGKKHRSAEISKAYMLKFEGYSSEFKTQDLLKNMNLKGGELEIGLRYHKKEEGLLKVFDELTELDQFTRDAVKERDFFKTTFKRIKEYNPNLVYGKEIKEE